MVHACASLAGPAGCAQAQGPRRPALRPQRAQLPRRAGGQLLAGERPVIRLVIGVVLVGALEVVRGGRGLDVDRGSLRDKGPAQPLARRSRESMAALPAA